MTIRGTSCRRSSVWLVRLALAAIMLVSAGCGGGKASSNSQSGSQGATSGLSNAAKLKTDLKVAKEVPAKFKSKGTLTVAADATYPPNESIDPNGHTIIGMDPELAKALGQVMGLKVNVVNATFDSILPGLQSGKYDLGMSSFGDTKAREKVVDFVTYFQAGTSFYVKAQGSPKINTVTDLCGHTVAVEKGTIQADAANAQDKKCRAAGKPAVTVLVFTDQNGANLALSSGRADVGMADSPPAAYLVKRSGGQFKLIGKMYGVVPYGIAIPKHSGLTKPVLDALKVLMSNGTYMTILKKSAVAFGALHNPTINGATS